MPTDTNYFQLEFTYSYKTKNSDGTKESKFLVTPANLSTEIILDGEEKITPYTQLVYTTFKFSFKIPL